MWWAEAQPPGAVRAEFGSVMEDAAVEVRLAGLRAGVDSTFPEFARYARLHLEPLRNAEGPAVVRSKLVWHEGVPPDREDAYPELAEMDRLDRDLYRGEDSLAWFRIDELPGLRMRVRRRAGGLDVRGDYYSWFSRDAVRDRLKRWIYARRLPALRRRRFTTLLYYLLYYPSFWWLERESDLHPIHAAGVELDGRVVVLAGPSGVGKSTLTAALAAREEGRLLSDTFLLHGGTEVRPVREPLLLDARSMAWLGPAGRDLEPIAWRYCLGRTGFHWRSSRLSEGGEAALVVFPVRTHKQHVRRLNPREGQGRIGAGNNIVNDLRRYWACAAVLDMFEPSPLAAAREASIEKLTAAVPCYEIGLPADTAREEAVELIVSLMPAGGAAAGDGVAP